MSDAPTSREDIPARPDRPSEDTSDDTSDDTHRQGLSHINMTPGPRRTRNVDMLVIEAELVAEGHEPDNPAQPIGSETAEVFLERIEDRDELEPAWLRPWEDAEGGT